ncbi:MAG: BBE domain-containing protein [Acidimicrobiales bacterium]
MDHRPGYLNLIGDEGLGRVEAAFGPERFARLRAIKRTWGPTNPFRHNQNIPPADQLVGRDPLAPALGSGPQRAVAQLG